MRQTIGGLPANEYHRRWREANREKVREVSRRSSAKVRALHPDRIKKYTAQFSASLNGVLSSYRNNAKRRGIEFALDPRLVDDLTTDFCYYCGATPIPRNGIDRVDNSRGYVENNVVTACGLCNRLKRADSMESFIGHAKLIAARFA